MFGIANANSPAALRRAHDRLADAARGGPPDRRRDAVHPHGRDGPGLDPGGPLAADRRAAGGHLPRPARAARSARRDGVVHLAHRHAVGLARLRRPRGGDRPPRLGSDRAPLRPPLARGRRCADLEPVGRRAGRLRGPQHDAAGLPGRRQPAAAHVRLAGVGPRRLVREVRARHRDRAHPPDQFSPLEFTREQLVPDAFAEAGHGGHFFGTTHTLENFRNCFYRPLLFSTENYERWASRGGKDATERARDRLADARGELRAARAARRRRAWHASRSTSRSARRSSGTDPPPGRQARLAQASTSTCSLGGARPATKIRVEHG